MKYLRRFRWAITAGLVLLTIGVCYRLWRPAPATPPPAAAIIVYTPTPLPTARPTPSPSPPPLVVYVSGAVVQTGVYALAPDARVADALAAAGGATPDANLDHINLARRIHDEEHVHIPRHGEPTQPAPTPLLAHTSPPAGSATGKVNINTASAAELDALPGIGPSYAERIVAYRESNGPFAQIEDIQNVPGIGPVTFEQIRDLITVE
jgi:competence protein ComEA